MLLKGVSVLRTETICVLPLAGEAAQQRCFAAGAVEGDPCHYVNCCPDAYASSVLSVDSVPAPSSDTGFCAAGGDGGASILTGYTPVV